MRNRLLCIVAVTSLALAGLAWNTGYAADAPKKADAARTAESAPVSTDIPPMILAGSSTATVFIVEGGKTTWSYKMPGMCQEAWVLENGNILAAGGNKVLEISRDKKVVWTYESPAGTKTELHNCQPLPGNLVLIGEGGTNKILEVDRKTGQVKKEVQVDLKGNAHKQMRSVRKTAAGTYVVASPGESAVVEFNDKGERLRKVSADNTKGTDVKWKEVHGLEILPNGNWLVGTSYGSCFFEIDKDNKVVWTLTPQDVAEIGLSYAPGVDVRPDGTLVISGYHSKFPVFAVNRDKKILWKFAAGKDEIGFPTNVRLIAQPKSPK